MLALLLLLQSPPPVSYQHLELPGPRQVHVAKVDLTIPNLELIPVAGFDHLRARERPSDIAKRLSTTGYQVLAIANADFGQPREGFGGPAHSPRSLFIKRGTLWNSPSPRSVFVVPQSGPPQITRFSSIITLRSEEGQKPVSVDSYNHWGPIDSSALFGPQWTLSEERPQNLTEIVFESDSPIKPNQPVAMKVVQISRTRGGLRIPENHYVLQLPRDSEQNQRFKPGQTWSLKIELTPKINIHNSIGGGPQILRNGEVEIRNEQEEISDDFVTTRHPRTAYGLDKEGKTLFIVVVDGRQENSIGVNLPELAQIMKDLGAHNAMNMDGGGSSTLIVDGILRNSPSDPTGERTTTSSLAVAIPR